MKGEPDRAQKDIVSQAMRKGTPLLSWRVTDWVLPLGRGSGGGTFLHMEPEWRSLLGLSPLRRTPSGQTQEMRHFWGERGAERAYPGPSWLLSQPTCVCVVGRAFASYARCQPSE